MKSVAVDPKIFPYGTKFKIPGFEQIFIAEDTGSWVKSKKASRRRAEKGRLGNQYAIAPVIDIAIETREEYEAVQKTTPEFLWVEIIK